MTTATLKYSLWALGAVLLQMLIFRHLRFFGAEPDFVLLYLIWIIARNDRTTALYHAAGMGLFIDVLLDLWGLNLLTKVAIVFLAYNFIPKETESKLLLSQVFMLILLVAFFHNLIFLGVTNFAQSRVDLIFWNVLLGNTLFTSIIGSFIYLFKSN
ncbi:MAG: rod shape-determining protein MreD [Balneolales bacterium]